MREVIYNNEGAISQQTLQIFVFGDVVHWSSFEGGIFFAPLEQKGFCCAQKRATLVGLSAETAAAAETD